MRVLSLGFRDRLQTLEQCFCRVIEGSLRQVRRRAVDTLRIPLINGVADKATVAAWCWLHDRLPSTCTLLICKCASWLGYTFRECRLTLNLLTLGQVSSPSRSWKWTARIPTSSAFLTNCDTKWLRTVDTFRVVLVDFVANEIFVTARCRFHHSIPSTRALVTGKSARGLRDAFRIVLIDSFALSCVPSSSHRERAASFSVCAITANLCAIDRSGRVKSMHKRDVQRHAEGKKCLVQHNE